MALSIAHASSLSFAGPVAPVVRSDVRMQSADFSVRAMPGITAPFGFFDPLGFTNGCGTALERRRARNSHAHAAVRVCHARTRCIRTRLHSLLRTRNFQAHCLTHRNFSLAALRARSASEGRVKFYREVELKHGRVAMLAALGFVVGEHFHPLWGGNVDVPSYIAWQETPLQDWMPLVGLVIAIHELTSVFTFNSPFGGEIFSIRSDYASGDLGWDPLGLKPTDAAALKEMQTKEINNGRLAMIAVAGMIGQELAQGSKLF